MRQDKSGVIKMSNKGSEFNGNIVGIREVEDSIRVTRKYTEGVRTIRKKHPVQGEDFPSRQFCKHYEVYPDTELSWDMPAGVALDWLWGEVPIVTVLFSYDYRANKASMVVEDGAVAVRELARSVPGFSDALARAIANGSGQQVKV